MRIPSKYPEKTRLNITKKDIQNAYDKLNGSLPGNICQDCIVAQAFTRRLGGEWSVGVSYATLIIDGEFSAISYHLPRKIKDFTRIRSQDFLRCKPVSNQVIVRGRAI